MAKLIDGEAILEEASDGSINGKIVSLVPGNVKDTTVAFKISPFTVTHFATLLNLHTRNPEQRGYSKKALINYAKQIAPSVIRKLNGSKCSLVFENSWL